MPPNPACSVMVFKRLGKDGMDEYRAVVRHLGEVEGMRVIVEPGPMNEFLSDLVATKDYIFTHQPADITRLSTFVDFVVCIGGDGVLLHVSHLFKHAMPPVRKQHVSGRRVAALSRQQSQACCCSCQHRNVMASGRHLTGKDWGRV